MTFDLGSYWHAPVNTAERYKARAARLEHKLFTLRLDLTRTARREREKGDTLNPVRRVLRNTEGGKRRGGTHGEEAIREFGEERTESAGEARARSIQGLER